MDCIFDAGDDMIEVLKQALDALETEVSIDWTNNDEFNASAEKMHDAITSLQQAIAELESQEPDKYEMDIECTKCGAKQSGVLTVNTHPPQRTWVGIEGEEIRNLWEEATKPDRSTMTMVTSFAKSIEAKLKEKNCL
jgi:hypothetical protein